MKSSKPEKHLPAGLFSIGVLCSLVAMVCGCDIPPRPPLSPADVQRPAISTDSSATEATAESGDPASEVLEGPSGSFGQPWETWDAYFVGNRQIGFSHVRSEVVGQRPESDVRYEINNLMYIRQGNARLRQQLLQTSLESHDGHLVSFESALQVGPITTRFNGAVRESQLEIEITRGSSRTTKRIPWESTYRGLVAIEQSIRQRPLQDKGATRTLKMVLPGRYELATVRMRCSGKAFVPLIDGTIATLNEINYEIETDNQTAFSTIWTDDDGAIVRTYSPALELVAYRTDKATAMKFDHDDSALISIPVTGTLPQSGQSQQLAMTITVTSPSGQDSSNPIMIKPAPDQFVRRRDDRTFEVLVRRGLDAQPPAGFDALSEAAAEEDSKSNAIVDSGATLIRRFADAAIGTRQMTQGEVALELTRTAHALIASGDGMESLTAASEVARDGTGNSTERAVMLAALLRARGIPARVAIGLRYQPASDDPAREPRMVYQMWTLAYVDGRWLNLDAMTGQTAAADRVTLATTNLSGGDELKVFVPVLNTVGRINVQIDEVQPTATPAS